MTVIQSTRQASVNEIAAEMDRRGAVIEKLEAERNLYKGKYRALLKLVSKTRDKLVHVTDHIEDEGDRRYFGSTNDADDLIGIYHEMMRWIWDAVDETNRMKSDPYADIRKQRARAEKAEAALTALASHTSALAERDARIAELEAALRPFAGVADFMDSETEGFSMTDTLHLVSNDDQFPDTLIETFCLQRFYTARAALAKEPSNA